MPVDKGNDIKYEQENDQPAHIVDHQAQSPVFNAYPLQYGPLRHQQKKKNKEKEKRDQGELKRRFTFFEAASFFKAFIIFIERTENAHHGIARKEKRQQKPE